MVVQFIIGALAGGLAVWLWGEDVRQFVGSKSTLQAGQDVLRPRAS